jgi:hypothetical protein
MLAKHLQVNAGKRPSIPLFTWQPISRDASQQIQKREIGAIGLTSVRIMSNFLAKLNGRD